MTDAGPSPSPGPAAPQGDLDECRSRDVEPRPPSLPVGFDAAHLARFIELIPAPVTVLDDEGMSLLVNRTYCEALELPPEVILARTVHEALHPDDVATARRIIGEAVTVGVGTDDLRMADAGGHYRTFHWTLMFDANIERVIAIAIDRTAELDRLAEARSHARTDDLTGLLNRTGLMEALDVLHHRHRKGGLAVALVDIDGFKEINDTNGHQAGDVVLRTTARRLEHAVRRQGTVGRLGGDEFVVALPCDVEPTSAIDDIVEAFTSPFVVAGRRLAVTVSIGWCVSSGTESVDDLLRRSDIAAYDAKRSGGGAATAATDELVAAWEDERSIERGLQLALVRDEFVPYFQPLVDPSSGEVAAYEVLMRWVTGEGVRPACEFLDIAQRSGLVAPISSRIRRVALRIAGERPTIRLGFNISADELLEPGFVDGLLASMQEHGVGSERVVVEITEQTALEDLDRAAVVLGELREHGLRVALDDFGAGYSSLTYLTLLPIDTVKLDGRFVAAAAEDPRAQLVLPAAVDFLRAIQMRVVVEGVETEEDHRRVELLGVDRVQGWFYGRPVPESELPR